MRQLYSLLAVSRTEISKKEAMVMNRNSIQEFESSRSGSGMSSNLTYLLIGGGIGAALALLFAPKSGSELRQDITHVAHRGYDETLELAGKLKDQSNQLYETVRDKADRLYGFASEKFNSEGVAGTAGRLTESIVEKGEELAGEAFENGVDIGNQKPGPSGMAKPSSDIH
jgi:gas vesicle protein